MWLPGDVQAAFEWQAEQDLLCGGCGQPRTESMADEDHGPDYQATSVRCRACEARDAVARADRENAREGGGDLGSGIYYGVKPVRS